MQGGRFAPTEPVGWDRMDLLRQVDDDFDLAVALMEIFLEDAPQMKSDISVAVGAGEAERLACAAHAYKGSAAAIGDRDLRGAPPSPHRGTRSRAG